MLAYVEKLEDLPVETNVFDLDTRGMLFLVIKTRPLAAFRFF
jgi:hypothetical protein